jgi:hypothetical protein
MALDLEKLASTWKPKLRDAFLAAIRGVTNRANLAVITRLLENGDIDAAFRALNIDPADFSQFALVHQQAFNDGGAAATNSIPPIPQPAGHSIRVLFNVRNPSAESWVSRRSSKFITEIVDDQRDTVRDFLKRGLAAGQNPRTVALDLVGRTSAASRTRTGGIIGLHSTQEQWLASYANDLGSTDPVALRSLLDRGLRDKRFDTAVLKAVAEGRGLSADTQVKMRTAYANKALKWRADNIARTETLRALGAAQTEAYQQAIDKGHLDKSLIRRFWQTAGDERVRPTHRLIPGMNKDGRGWDEPFQTPDGPSMRAPHDKDPQCRCKEVVRIDFLARAIAKHRANIQQSDLTQE